MVETGEGPSTLWTQAESGDCRLMDMSLISLNFPTDILLVFLNMYLHLFATLFVYMPKVSIPLLFIMAFNKLFINLCKSTPSIFGSGGNG